jgi:hypothetical protein
MLRFFLAILILLVPVISPATDLSHAGSDNLQSGKLRWSKNSFRIAISQSLTAPNSNIKINSDVTGAIEESLRAWESAANITFQRSFTDRLSVSPSGPAGDGISLITIAQTPENVLMFDKGISDASARTRVFIDKRGFITEADIVLNPFQQFSTDGSLGTYDLQSALTHEIGHLLGLGHSPVLGATMFESLGKNGSYSMQSRFARTLSAEDIAAVRALYGTNSSDCCGRIVGKITAPRTSKDLQVWVENADTAAVAAETDLAADGSFQVGGLSSGKYRVMIQSSTSGKFLTPASEVAVVDVSKGNASRVTETIKPANGSIDFRYIGVGSQLGTIAAPLNAGRSYKFMVGGKTLPDKFQIGSDSPFIEVDTSSLTSDNYNDSTAAAVFTVRVKPDARPGDYSLYLQGENGAKRYLVGAITVETYEDPTSLFVALPY